MRDSNQIWKYHFLKKKARLEALQVGPNRALDALLKDTSKALKQDVEQNNNKIPHWRKFKRWLKCY